jgi:hypothetical protein
MTDKEQIIIDGVNVYGCVQFIQEEEDCCNLGGSCKGWPNCYYKQLARKTQEYKELEKYTQAQENQREIYYKEFLRKDKALEELKDKLKIYEKMFDNPEFRVALTDIRTGERDIREQRDKRLTEKFDRYRKALEPFEDEYFKGLDTKQIAELAKKSIRLTTENRKLENKLSDIAGICEQILDGEDYVRRIAKTILDIID